MAVAEPSAHGRAEAGEPCGEASFDAFADVQAKRHGFIGVELDGGAARATEHLAVELAPGTVEEGSVNAARLVRSDIAKERHHRTEQPALEFERRMKPDHVAGDVIREREVA
jgi:hypothetical protein